MRQGGRGYTVSIFLAGGVSGGRLPATPSTVNTTLNPEHRGSLGLMGAPLYPQGPVC